MSSGNIIFDTGTSSNPYPSIRGIFKGKLTIKDSGYVKITGIRTRSCPGTEGHVSSWSIQASNNEYNIEVHLTGYPQFFHGVDKIENEDGIIKASSFIDANGRTYTDWIPSLIIEGETLPGLKTTPGRAPSSELSCDNPTPSFASGCELLLHYDEENDGKISYANAVKAVQDYYDGIITQEEAEFVIEAWKKDSINAVCPGCYTPSVSITFVTKDESGAELHGVKVYIDEKLKGET
ncbi:MAG: hypothetical protein ACXQTD_04300 [Candidatus Syntropharchaeia archaeon]